jgi:hypothetical protein
MGEREEPYDNPIFSTMFYVFTYFFAPPFYGGQEIKKHTAAAACPGLST